MLVGSYRLFNLRCLSPDVGNESRVTVAADGIFEASRQSGLAEWNVVAAPIRQCQHHLLEETQGLVDIHRLLLRLPFRLQNTTNSAICIIYLLFIILFIYLLFAQALCLFHPAFIG